MLYPAIFTNDEATNSITVTFKDIPEAITCGYSHEEAIEMAEDALKVSLEFYFEKRKVIPLPSVAGEKDVLIRLPASMATKVFFVK